MNNSEVDEIIDADQTLINETAAPAIADEVLPDTLYLMPIPQRPFFPGQAQPVAINLEQWKETLKTIDKSGQSVLGRSALRRFFPACCVGLAFACALV